ncbi:MAG: lysophospholipid acyltransferase family protein [Acidimicrobiia bacterium]|nr:lysophospholipid acyltransferase family protein [Acidimicrobiia bacterium]
MLGNVVAAIRTVIFVPLFVLYSMLLATIVIIWGAVNPASPVHDALVDHWSRVFLRIPPVTVRAEGLENVDPDQRYVVASNHLSQFDIPLLFSVLPVHGRFLSKKEVFRIPLVGQAMRTIGIIEIDRQAGGSSRQAINEGVRVAAERGYSLLIFPEGTRSRDGNLLPFKKGAARIAIDTQLPVLPVIIEGSDRISKPETPIIHAGEVHVRILEPISTEGMTNRDDLNPLLERIETSIGANYAQMREAALAES